jgi:preprotein translocase subunit YajC
MAMIGMNTKKLVLIILLLFFFLIAIGVMSFPQEKQDEGKPLTLDEEMRTRAPYCGTEG